MSRLFAHINGHSNDWRMLTPIECALVSKLLSGPSFSNEELAKTERLLAKETGELGCWRLAFPEQTSLLRRVQKSAPFVGDAVDLDGEPLQATLHLDEFGDPVEFEVFRLDGAPIQAVELGDLNFNFVLE